VLFALAFACAARTNMPTYVYKCADNGHVFDLVQGFNDEPGAVCSTCGSASSRQITVPTVIYKGSGFYTTDYGPGATSKNGGTSGSKSKAGTESESGSNSRSESGSSTKSESGSSSSSSESKSSGGGKNGDGHSHGGSSHSHGAGSHTH
jgi:putative FmdB family regulatory protein